MSFKPFVPLVEPLQLPSEDGSKVYTIKPVGMGAAAQFMLSIDPKSKVELTAIEQQTLLLGAMRDQLIADDVTPEYFIRVFLTVVAEVQKGRATAEVMWETGGDPKAIEAWTARQDSQPSTNMGEETVTPSPASTSTTTSSRPSTKRSGTVRKSRGTNS